jgi:hypothetical protein
MSSDNDRIVVESLCFLKILAQADTVRFLELFELADGYTEFQSLFDRSVIISQLAIGFRIVLQTISTGKITTILSSPPTTIAFN